MKKKERRRVRRTIFAIVSGIALVMIGALGWQWASGLMVEQIHIHGYRHAELYDLRALVQVDSADAMIDIDPDSIADDVMQHPWVKHASVTRWPTGRLQIKVEERVPVALALDREGVPFRFLDSEGAVMPLVANAVYHVPTIAGLPPSMLFGTAIGEPAGDMLMALERVPREVNALIGHIEYRDGELWVQTLPTADGATVPVRLGKQDFEHRLLRMHSFWHRAVLSQPEKRFVQVDLRFNSQVVTRESEREP